MNEVLREAAIALEKGNPCVLATVIRTKGSTPQKPGAKLLIRDDGSSVGTLGGGCVEAEVWAAARGLLREGSGALVLDYTLNDALAAQDGLICGGTIYFLVQPIWKVQPLLDHIREIVDAFAGGPPVAIASLIHPPQDRNLAIGTGLFVRENGEFVGTLGDSLLDEMASRKSRELMAYGKCEYLTSDDGAELFVETFTSPPTLVLLGGGHIGKALAPLAKGLGYRVFVIDDREEFVSPDRFPYADGLILSGYEKGLKQVQVSANTCIVVATRGHHYDDTATEVAARSPASYVALVGSKRKVLLVFEELFKRGLPEERVREIRAPVGLDIGARTPEEIAVSIMAEILMCRLGGTGRPMKLEERLLSKAKEKVNRRLKTG